MLEKSTLSANGCSWEWAEAPTQNTCPLPFLRPLSCCGRSDSGEKAVRGSCAAATGPARQPSAAWKTRRTWAPLARFLPLFPGSGAAGARGRDLRCPGRGASGSQPRGRRRRAQSRAGARRAHGQSRARSRAGAYPQRGAAPHPSPAPASRRLQPGPAMGNVPSAVKHCLSYQQLLREHLWIADAVPGALDPAQVPPRGPGCPQPLADGQRGLSPPVRSPLHPMPFPQLSAVRGLTLDKVSQHLSAVNM